MWPKFHKVCALAGLFTTMHLYSAPGNTLVCLLPAPVPFFSRKSGSGLSCSPGTSSAMRHATRLIALEPREQSLRSCLKFGVLMFLNQMLFPTPPSELNCYCSLLRHTYMQETKYSAAVHSCGGMGMATAPPSMRLSWLVISHTSKVHCYMGSTSMYMR